MATCPACGHENPAGTPLCGECGATLPNISSQPTTDVIDELLSLIRSGEKIAAVKLFRAKTGASLVEAKEAVEAIERGETPAQYERSKVEDWQQEVLILLRERQKIEAIKLYREQNGVGLKEAKEAVEALAAEHGISTKGSGCAILLAACRLVSLGGYWIA